MSIIQTVNKSQFIDNLLGDDYASWTYEEAEALFDYYEDYSDSTGEDVELDRALVKSWKIMTILMEWKTWLTTLLKLSSLTTGFYYLQLFKQLKGNNYD